MNELEDTISECIDEATEKHKARSIAYWNALMEVKKWWESLPHSIRQDLEGSGREPYAIFKVRQALQ